MPCPAVRRDGCPPRVVELFVLPGIVGLRRAEWTTAQDPALVSLAKYKNAVLAQPRRREMAQEAILCSTQNSTPPT